VLGSRPRRTQNSTRFWQSLIILLAPHQDQTKCGQRYKHSTWSLVSLLGHFSVGEASRTFLTNLTMEIMGTWLNQHSWDLSTHRKSSKYGFVNFTSAYFVAKCQAMNTLLKSCICHLHMRSHCFRHFPRFMTMGEDQNKDQFKN